MIKKGFTLAEVLITLAIIGVAAAITLPSFIADTTAAQIGPKLAKAASMFEQANQALLSKEGVDLLTDVGGFSSEDSYLSKLENYLKGSANDDEFQTNDGILYTVDKYISGPSNKNAAPHKQRVGMVTVDINGTTKPNEDGTDIFYFSWWNDGSLRPKGGTNWDGGATSDTDDDGNPTSAADSASGTMHWTTQCAKNSTPTDPEYCAGHIFENNLKVFYK